MPVKARLLKSKMFYHHLPLDSSGILDAGSDLFVDFAAAGVFNCGIFAHFVDPQMYWGKANAGYEM